MALQDDYIGDDVPDDLKEIMQTKGIHRQILEVKNLKAVTELCIKTTKNLKYQTLNNITCIAFGAVLSFGLNYYYSKDEKSTTLIIHSLLIENTKLTNDFQTYRYATNKQLLELKKQLEKQKK